jgi:hypothetical protein
MTYVKSFLAAASLAIGTATILFSGVPTSAQDGAASLSTRMQDAARAGGGVVRLEPNQRLVVNDGVVLPRGVTLDLAGGELVAVLRSTNAAGVRMLSGSAIRNGTVSVISRGTPGEQSGAHAAILVGALYSENASPARMSPFAAPSSWRISRVSLRSDKRSGAAGIQIMGGANRGLIENVTVLDSDRMVGGIMLDWGTVGPVSSADVRGTAAAFARGQGWTTHPHDIDIRGVKIGRLTRSAGSGGGSVAVRLSGVHDVRVSGVVVEEVTQAGVIHHAGDLGYEFARAADAPRAHQGIVVENIDIRRTAQYVVWSDSHADNVARAANEGYRPRLAPIAATDIAFRQISGNASPRSGAQYGIRVNHQRGGSFSDVRVSGFDFGFFIDEQVYSLDIVRPDADESRKAAYSIGHPSRPPQGIRVSNPRASGSSDESNLVYIGNSADVRVVGAKALRSRIARSARRAKVD